jgi:hypothetical protein
MGKQAKLKKQKKLQQNTTDEPIINDNPDLFIQDIEHTGYHFKNIQRSPEIPKPDNSPKL